LKLILIINFIFLTAISSGCVDKAEDFMLFQEEKVDDEDYVDVNQTYVQNLLKRNAEYKHRLMPGNRITVEVYKQPQLSVDVNKGGIVIRDNGTIKIPLVGEIEVAGLTIEEMEDTIEEKLEKYIRYVHVSASVYDQKSMY